MVKRARKKQKSKKLLRAFKAVISAIFALLGWIASHLWAWARRNPIAATGFCLFAFAFMFVAYNAVFSQSQIHRHFLFATRADLASRNGQQVSAPVQGVTNQILGEAKNLPLNANGKIVTKFGDSRHNSLGLIKPEDWSTQTNLKLIQEKLHELGFYQGTVDGLIGPKTRDAIAAWNNHLASSPRQMVKQEGGGVELATLIKQSDKIDVITTQTLKTQADKESQLTSPEMIKKDNDPPQKLKQQQASVQSAKRDLPETFANEDEISRVQMALRAFGNDEVTVTGKMDTATANAILSFQKMFLLKPTGKIDTDMLKKMQEIGLIG